MHFLDETLPQLSPQAIFLKDGEKYIYDAIRKKPLKLTPEEYVRQCLILFLIEKKYPKGLISLEKGLVYNKLQKRTDLVVFDRHASPYLLVECKAPHVRLSTQVLTQALTYYHFLGAKYICLTNGGQIACYQMLGETMQVCQSFPDPPND